MPTPRTPDRPPVVNRQRATLAGVALLAALLAVFALRRAAEDTELGSVPPVPQGSPPGLPRGLPKALPGAEARPVAPPPAEPLPRPLTEEASRRVAERLGLTVVTCPLSAGGPRPRQRDAGSRWSDDEPNRIGADSYAFDARRKAGVDLLFDPFDPPFTPAAAARWQVGADGTPSCVVEPISRGTAQVIVLDEAGRPVPDVSVWSDVMPTNGRTDADGVVTVDVFNGGPTRVTGMVTNALHIGPLWLRAGDRETVRIRMEDAVELTAPPGFTPTYPWEVAKMRALVADEQARLAAIRALIEDAGTPADLREELITLEADSETVLAGLEAYFLPDGTPAPQQVRHLPKRAPEGLPEEWP